MKITDMPSGTVHYQNWKYFWISTIGASILFFYLGHLVIAIGILLGYLMGAYIDNDLDIAGMSASEGRMLKIPILGWFMVAYSTLYGAIFRKHHRSFITHFPVVSTFIRVLFFFWWIPILYWKGFIRYEEWQLLLFIGMFAGLSWADAIHWIADIWPKKRLDRNKKRW